MIYGYIRVSTQHQSLERQERNIRQAYPDVKIYADKFSGGTMARPNWVKLLNVVQPGDTIVFDAVDRMSRNATEGAETYFSLFDKNINLEFLKQPAINTETYRSKLEEQIDLSFDSGKDYIDNFTEAVGNAVNNLIRDLARIQIEASFTEAEAERNKIRQRTKEGLVGKTTGFPVGTVLHTKKEQESMAIIRKHSKSFGGTLSDAECIRQCGCSRNSFYKYKKMVAEAILAEEMAVI